MIKYYWTRYLPLYPKALLYMLQTNEYKFGRYLKWFFKTADFRRVMKRQQLDMTAKVRALLLIARLTTLLFFGVVALLVVVLIITDSLVFGILAALVFLLIPYLLALVLILPLGIGYWLIQRPQEKKIIAQAKKKLEDHPAVRIAIAGSYGKTTAKELLLAVLKEGKKVATTPGNMNTAIGISRFARKLNGDEDVLVFELGEEKVGDVARLARIVRPDIGVITGISEAHLESFKTLDRTIETIFELAEFVKADKLYTNADNQLVREERVESITYTTKGANGWKVTKAATSVLGTDFVATKKDKMIQAHIGLIGLHNIGPAMMAIAIADSLGLTPAQIQNGLENVVPYEHRMEPRPLHGAWIIDDTYNGNSEGIKAGLAFLKTTQATRRVYVTPGLVEQGSATQKVHEEIGRQIAESADVVVLMRNSVTDYIVAGLNEAKFEGVLLEIDEPLEFYQNLDQFVAAGDVVLMQNDWTDNYR